VLGARVPVLLHPGHGPVDGAVLPALAAMQPAVAAWLVPGHASQELFANGPLGTIVDAGVPLFIVGALLLGVTIARARRRAPLRRVRRLRRGAPARAPVGVGARVSRA
jgi:hypothetical protein